MRPLKSFFFAYLFSVVVFQAFAQEEFKDGFIVDNNQNYVYGFISFTGTPQLNCVFKEQKEGTAVTYRTDDIQGYGVINGNPYRKRSVLLPGESFETEIFIEAVVDGTVTLYVMSNRMFIERGPSFYELKNDPQKEQGYRNILISFMSDCGKISKQAEKVSIEIYSIKALVQSYNQCDPSDKSSQKVRVKSAKEYGVFVGVDRTQFSIEGTANTILVYQKFTDRTLPVLGAHYKFAPGWSKHFSLVSGLWFNDQRFYLNTHATIGMIRRQTMRVNYRALRIPLLLEVGNFLTSKLQPYVKGGVSVPLMLNSDVTITQEDENNNTIYIDKYTASTDFSEPMLVQVLAGVSLPINARISAYGEVYYSRGKNKFTLESPQRGTVSGIFASTGLHVGVVLRSY